MTDTKQATKRSRFLARLLRDEAGNTIAIMAAAVIPTIGLVGGAVDMSRIYVVKSRLQSACDAGALMGRRTMGTGVWAANDEEADKRATELFKANFKSGAYGSKDLQFSYAESGGVVTGQASARVDMTLMRVLGQEYEDIAVDCKAEMRMPASDIMFVLDTTGSMSWAADSTTAVSATNPSRINGLRTAARCFYEAVTKKNITDVTPAQCAETADPTNPNSDVRIRFGFVPYSVNVNVGKLLPLDYIADSWPYQTRAAQKTVSPSSTYTLGTPSSLVQGTPAAPVNQTPVSTSWTDYGQNLIIGNATNYPSISVPNATTSCSAYTSNVSSYRPETITPGTWVETGRTPATITYPTNSQTINYSRTDSSYKTEFQYNLVTQNGSTTSTTRELVCRNRDAGGNPVINPFPTYVTVTPGSSTNRRNISANYTAGSGGQARTCNLTSNNFDISGSATFDFLCRRQNNTQGVNIRCQGENVTTTTPTTTKTCQLQSRQNNRQTTALTATSTVPVNWNLVYQFDKWKYQKATLNVSALKDIPNNAWRSSVDVPIGTGGTLRSAGWNGCIQERKTAPIMDNDPSDDWNPIPSDALDMDIENAPNPADPNTQWGPSLNSTVYSRYKYNGSNWQGSMDEFETTSSDTYTALTYNSQYYYTGDINPTCPTESKLYKVWTPTDFSSYLGGLSVGGNTYHDIGLLWGARLMAPNGMFSAVTKDTQDPIERHMIFMTDGDTNAFNTDYSAYGIHWWDRRQSNPSSGPSQDWLEKNIDARTAAVCKWVKDENITLWVIAFGKSISEDTETRLKACATTGRYYKADDTTTLMKQFKSIASQISALRMTQ